MSVREIATTTNLTADPDEAPPLLSQTGLFRSTVDLIPNKGVIPYQINVPAWVDGAGSRRWIVLPGNSSIRTTPAGSWVFPQGTILVQHLEIDPNDTNRGNSEGRRLETRILRVDRQGHGYGVTYRWQPDGRDAALGVARWRRLSR